VTAPMTVRLEGLEVFAHHGVQEHERRDGQPFLFDVELEPASDGAQRTDELADAVDYGAVAGRVVELGQGGPHQLLERLAALVADDLIATFPLAAVRVTVHKPLAPIPHPFGDVSVTVERRVR
jgi:dihydroneopterin aldolase